MLTAGEICYSKQRTRPDTRWKGAADAMAYLIDGHNLIGQLPDLSLTDPNDEALLVQKLLSFVARTKAHCVVVFDAGLPGGTSKMSTRHVKVVFAPSRSSADRVLMERIRQEKQPQDWTVVSNDNEVLAEGRRRRMQTMTAAQFAGSLRRPAPATPPGRDEAVHVQVSAAEVEEWLRIFGESPPHRPRQGGGHKPHPRVK